MCAQPEESGDVASSVSVVVPAYNAEAVLDRCLAAILGSTRPALEVLVIDDGSTDETPRIAVRHGVRLLRTARARSGPATARNLGAREARGSILLFVDSDVIVRPDTLDRAARILEDDPETAAVFGSYDDDPAEPDFLSQYKNLQHHWVHQHGNPVASTFWAGCGAVRRDVFLALDGFDATRFPAPSIEDIELGHRMIGAGHRIRLDRDLCVKHLKRWRFWPLLRTEIRDRAAPWSRLMLQSGGLVRDLNLKVADRVSALLAWLVLGGLGCTAWWPPAGLLAFGALGSIIVLNREFYGFFVRRRGWLFTLRVLPMHLLYYLYSSATFAGSWLMLRLAWQR
jgi:glycosyltransferase involved in cell wall biosynthesis